MTATTDALPAPKLEDWVHMSWRARQEWARIHGVTLSAANLAVARAHAPAHGRQTRQIPGWTDAQHRASLAGDHDRDTVLARRAAATGLLPSNPRLLTPELPRSTCA